jgi:hypothetical protein
LSEENHDASPPVVAWPGTEQRSVDRSVCHCLLPLPGNWEYHNSWIGASGRGPDEVTQNRNSLVQLCIFLSLLIINRVII